MRIEIFASGGSSVSQMQSGLDSLHSGINATIQALKKTRRKIEYLPGPASSLTSEAMGRLQNRISAEQSKMERVEKLSQDVNAFLGHTAQTDAQVSRTITQNQSKFFAENPWSKPISSGNSSAWNRFLDGWNSFWSDASDAWNGFWSSAIEGWNNFWDDAQNLWNTVKEGWEGFVRDATEVLKKAWTGVVTFVKEHAVELIVGTVAIVVGAVLIALTAGTATPFLAAFGGALLAGFKAAAVSAVVGGAISTIVAAFTGEDLLTAFADGFASGYMWGGIFFAFGAAINFMKPKFQAFQKSLKAKYPSWKEMISDESGYFYKGTGSERTHIKVDGTARELRFQEELIGQYPKSDGYKIIREPYLRNQSGQRVVDTVTNTRRRLDFVVVKNGKVAYSYEVTTHANVNSWAKLSQAAKEARIRAMGGNFIRDKGTGKLIEIPKRIITKIIGRD